MWVGDSKLQCVVCVMTVWFENSVCMSIVFFFTLRWWTPAEIIPRGKT